MILPVYLYGSGVLREVAKPITEDYPNIRELIDNMFETMHNADGIGLAAPQIGRSIRLFVIDISPLDTERDFPQLRDCPKQKVFINAEITERYGDTVIYEEGCLSIPKINEKVPRPDKIKIKYLDETFREHEDEFEGYFARVIQHECDHIDGKMFVDHISPLRKQLIKSKLADIVKRKTTCSYKTK